jgi:hypothetical protein
MGFADLCQALEQCKRNEDAEQAHMIASRLHALLDMIKEQIETNLAAP